MSTNARFIKSEGAHFSEALDILIAWGRIHLLQKNEDDRLNALEEAWKQMGDPLTSLKAGADGFSANITLTLDYLHGAATVDAETAEEPWIKSGFEILDQVVFLANAFECFPHAEKFDDAIHERVEGLLQEATIEREPPGIRFIPLNQWRREMLERIPADVHYLFPWYGAWSDVSENAFDELSMLLSGSRDQNEREVLTEGISSALLAELKSDRMLFAHFRRESAVFKLMPSAVAESLSLSLFAIGEEIRRQGITAKPYDESTLLAAACRIIDEPLKSEFDRAERLFIAAFCGPFLGDRDRMELLTEVEDFILRIKDSPIPNGSITERICLWAKGNLGDEDLADELVNWWERRLAAIVGPPDKRAAFRQAVENVRKADVGPDKKMLMVDREPIQDTILKRFRTRITSFNATWFTKPAAATMAVCLLVFMLVFNLEILFQPAGKKSHELKIHTGDQQNRPVISRQVPLRRKQQSTSPSSIVFIPEEKIESLAPLYKDVPADPNVSKKISLVQKADVDRLKLTAIVLTPRGKRALLEDQDGRGYIVTQNAFVGRFRVVDILKNKIIMEKETVDLLGKKIIVKKELVLHF
jgi:hypothetical protein